MFTPHTEERTRNTHVPVTDATDWADADVDEPADFDGLGGEVTDTVGAARVLAALETRTKAEREEYNEGHVPYRSLCRFHVVGR